MARPATGQVIEDRRRRSPVFGLRFRAYGRRHYVTLGTADDGWTRAKAQTELENVLADVQRGIWRPPEPEPAPDVSADPTFHEFSSRWFNDNRASWRPKTHFDYEWQLSHHLLPFFKNLSQITIPEVDRYRAAKVRERTLSAATINRTIARLAQILEVAVGYEPIDRNPAEGKRGRLKASKPAPGMARSRRADSRTTGRRRRARRAGTQGPSAHPAQGDTRDARPHRTAHR
jgi:Phage integrase, N-terminal SAM-like domain